MAYSYNIVNNNKVMYVLQLINNYQFLKLKLVTLFSTTTLVRQLEADILTISRGNSILVLSCSFKVSKYISACRAR